jgi:TldD protein
VSQSDLGELFDLSEMWEKTEIIKGRIMEQLLTKILEKALLDGCEYADVRFEDGESEAISVKNEKMEAIKRNQYEGFGIRVLKNGAWGFSSSSTINESSFQKVLKEAITIANASRLVPGPSVLLGNPEKHIQKVPNQAKKDPFAIPLSEKMDLLTDTTNKMNIGPEIQYRNASLRFRKIHKWFASTEGSMIEQDRMETGAGLSAVAIGNDDMQTRSYPNSFGGDFSILGYEFVEQMDLPGNAKKYAEEAKSLLFAKQCEEGIKDIVLDGNQLALQVHESIGHPTELDRIYGFEAAYAGTSFLVPEHLNHLQLGSLMVNITADATAPGALGSIPYDDEGVPGQKIFLVKNGLFVGYLNSRETAAMIGMKPMGAMRADHWSHIPLIRMTSINLLPGDKTLDELFRGIQDGLFISGIKSWSIDDRRLNFQFGSEIAWEIKNGKLGNVVKNPSYIGVTPAFWNSCDGISKEDFYHVWGVPNCGKGEPSQIMTVSHGTSPARFRNVKVGVAR